MIGGRTNQFQRITVDINLAPINPAAKRQGRVQAAEQYRIAGCSAGCPTYFFQQFHRFGQCKLHPGQVGHKISAADLSLPLQTFQHLKKVMPGQKTVFAAVPFLDEDPVALKQEARLGFGTLVFINGFSKDGK